MSSWFEVEIRGALKAADGMAQGGEASGVEVSGVEVLGGGSLPSYFDVSGLATASVASAAQELALLEGGKAAVDSTLACRWFDMTLRPTGWEAPGLWDAVAGDYATRDGWIRLHTNARHHRDAALAVLGCGVDRAAVAEAVAGYDKAALETAIVAAGGCAAAMYDMGEWAASDAGAAVMAEPLIAWEEVGQAAPAEVKTGLAGLKVLDLTRVLAGPVATRFLAGFGADVLRIDPPDWEEGAVIPEVVLGKRCAGLDLKTARDRATLKGLLAQADVLVHGYRLGALEGLGFGAARLREINPALIDVTLNAYGVTGPWATRRGFDSLVQMSSGIAAHGMADAGANRPVPLPVQALDHATGYLMAAAVLRAVRVRQETGRVLRARLSLARTGALLTGAGTQNLSAALAPETSGDLVAEETGWGPAQRVRFPVTLNGAGPQWRHQAGPLRRDAPRWK